MIKAIEGQIERTKSARSAHGREFINRAERLLLWLRTGVLPEPLDEAERTTYRHIAEILVARREMHAAVLAYLSRP
jgi:hypothetical protein